MEGRLRKHGKSEQLEKRFKLEEMEIQGDVGGNMIKSRGQHESAGLGTTDIMAFQVCWSTQFTPRKD